MHLLPHGINVRGDQYARKDAEVLLLTFLTTQLDVCGEGVIAVCQGEMILYP